MHRLRVLRETDDGFTLVELVVALALSAFAFAALAGALLSGMTALAASKTRADANEIGTQGIEDLQHYEYSNLGLCAAPSASPPSGLSSTVLLPGSCPSPASPTDGIDPCNTPTGSEARLPRAVYACRRNGVNYTVTRYISWSDPGQTVKRLAVYVDWTDRVGTHQVSQQSSVRTPGVASFIGLPPPALTTSASSTSPPVVLIRPTSPQSRNTDVVLNVQATGLATTDKVYATFQTLDNTGAPQKSSVDLTPVSGDPANWSGRVQASDPFTFGVGTQYFTFSAVRAADGRQGTAISPSLTKFCPEADPSCATVTTIPTISLTSVSPNPAGIFPSGALKQNLALSASSTNLGPSDSVAATFQTVGGLVSVPLSPNSTCSVTSCTWTGSISTSAGYGFAVGSQKFAFTGFQSGTGQTTATSSATVTFS